MPSPEPVKHQPFVASWPGELRSALFHRRGRALFLSPRIARKFRGDQPLLGEAFLKACAGSQSQKSTIRITRSGSALLVCPPGRIIEGKDGQRIEQRVVARFQQNGAGMMLVFRAQEGVLSESDIWRGCASILSKSRRSGRLSRDVAEAKFCDAQAAIQVFQLEPKAQCMEWARINIGGSPDDPAQKIFLLTPKERCARIRSYFEQESKS